MDVGLGRACKQSTLSLYRHKRRVERWVLVIERSGTAADAAQTKKFVQGGRFEFGYRSGDQVLHSATLIGAVKGEPDL